MSSYQNIIDRVPWRLRIALLVTISLGLFALSQNIGHANQVSTVRETIRGCSNADSAAWPACAVQGGLTTALMQRDVKVLGSAEIAHDTRQNLMGEDNTQNAAAAECVIPASGPWPPCARGQAPASSTSCVIPDSGPWPPCATGANGAANAANARAANSAADEAAFNATFNRLYNVNSNGGRADARLALSYNEKGDMGNMEAVSLSMRPMVSAFSVNNLMVASSVVRGAADTMGGEMDRFYARSHPDEWENCNEYGSAYVLAATSPMFTNVPTEWQAMVGQYEAAIFTLLESNQDRMVQHCITGGQWSELYLGFARAGVDRGRDQIQPVMEAAIMGTPNK